MQWSKFLVAAMVMAALLAPAARADSVASQPVRFSLSGTIDTPGTGVPWLSNINLGDEYQLTFDVVPTAPRQVSGDVVDYHSFYDVDSVHHPVITEVSLHTESGFHFSHNVGTSGSPQVHESWASYDRASGAVSFHARDDEGTGFDLQLDTDDSFPADWFWDVAQPPTWTNGRTAFTPLSGALHFNFWLDGSIDEGGTTETGGPVHSHITAHVVPAPSAVGLGGLAFAMLLLRGRARWRRGAARA